MVIAAIIVIGFAYTCPDPLDCERAGLVFCIDWNGDGDVNPDDLGGFIADWIALAPCADVNSSSAVDDDDLSEYITAYFGA